ncbi:MAG TPA: DUF1552 domain-containing protein [Bryobacteraceae bacterium]|nr:DUF1552 domain-containing protein [Bryobacteraceae bacterium]
MFITKKHLSRRTVLRGMGVTLALPWLDAMLPAQTPIAKTAAKGATHLGFVYFPHGAVMDKWTPAKEGAGFEFTPILKPLEPHRKYLTVVSGLGNRAADGSAVHATAPGTWLSGVAPRPTHEPYAGVTVDQIAALHIGQDTPLPSLELTTEDRSSSGSACDREYGCSYANTISFRTPTTPLPMEYDPHKVFEVLFGQGATAEERRARSEEFGSILDAVTHDAATLGNTLSAQDKSKLGDYLESIREIERRLQRMGKGVSANLALPDIAPGVPEAFEERIDLMFDMAALAFQANITRIFSMMMTREASNLTYGQIGVPDAFHPVSHHQNNPQKLERLAKIQTYHSKIFARFVAKLDKMPDGDGSMLDHSLLLYGSNMSNSNLHNHFPLPVSLVGGACGRVKGNQHLRFTDHTPMANVLLSVLDRTGIPLEKIGDSTGEIAEI